MAILNKKQRDTLIGNGGKIIDESGNVIYDAPHSGSKGSSGSGG